MTHSGGTLRAFLTDSLHLVALCGFAIAQPLYDLVGHNAEFLVAHRADRRTIVSLVLVLSAAVPAALIALELVAAAAGTRFRHHLHTILVACLLALLFASIAARTAWGAPLALGAAAAAATLATIAYRKLPAARTFLTVVSPAALIFPLVFVFTGPVSRLAFPPAVPAQGLSVAPDSPVVLVVFDELSTFALLDDEGRLDRARYPSFAALGDGAWWFPDATSAASHTERSAPAIVTGVEPSAGLIPIAADYPRSLFTWLGTSHRLHVSESVTALCPAALCTEADTDRRMLLSDLGVLYLHVVTPRGLAARRLPPVSSTWKGFGAPAPPPVRESRPALDMMREFEQSVGKGRDGIFREFVAGIEKDDEQPTLHFIHSALPHHPYHYLPSGRVYSRGVVAEGLGTDGVWTADGALVTTGLRQYLQQVEFVDRLLGELVARMKSQGLYERALLIVTSDHGVAFRPGQSHRSVVTATNYRDLSAVPMFVKLPEQSEGHVDSRQVSGLDIMPTIAAALKAPQPWRMDGVSMFDAARSERAVLAFRGSAGEPLGAFDVLAEARTPERQARLRAALNEAAATGGAVRLIGMRVSDLQVAEGDAALRLVSDSLLDFRSVDPASGFLPALVHGNIGGYEPAAASATIAVALNGTVRAVTHTSRWNGAEHYFAVLLPESAVQPGRNTVEVFELDARAERIVLRRISSGLSAGLELGADLTHLLASDGSRIPFRTGIEGWVDRVEESPGVLRLHGWAADRSGRRATRAIVAFAGSTMIASTVATGERPDVSAALDLPPSTRTLFMLELPLAKLGRGPIRVIGVSESGFAGELQINAAAVEALRRLH